jgi:hypothetical protein
MNWKLLSVGAGLFCLLGIGILLIPIRGENEPRPSGSERSRVLDLSAYAAGAPERPMDLLFIHHSCGGQLLAAPGADQETNCIYVASPNGGGLRSRLEQNSYRVHEVSYGSRLGEKTDLFDWLPKFRNEMDQILVCDRQDTSYADGRRNQIVVFKSCFPNSAFTGEGELPGNPAGPELTLANAKASFSALLAEFRKYPHVLFVSLTAPPIAHKNQPQPLWRHLVNSVRGNKQNPAASARIARQFNNWLTDQDGWLKDSNLTNVVVFDYYDILTGYGKSDLSVYPTGDGWDSHPSQEGNAKAAEAFIPFLNRAVRRAGLSN